MRVSWCTSNDHRRHQILTLWWCSDARTKGSNRSRGGNGLQNGNGHGRGRRHRKKTSMASTSQNSSKINSPITSLTHVKEKKHFFFSINGMTRLIGIPGLKTNCTMLYPEDGVDPISMEVIYWMIKWMNKGWKWIIWEWTRWWAM